MDKLLTVVCVALFAVSLAAQTPPVQKPGTQPPATQTPPKTPPKQVTPPPAQAPPPAKPVGQTPPQTPPAAKSAVPAAASQAAARGTVTLFVTNAAGQPIQDAKVTLSGTADREGVTGREGSVRMPNLRSGTYRARVDAPDYVLFEKELALRAGQMLEAEVTLNLAPVKKVELPPLPPPSPPKKVAEVTAEPAGEVVMLSLSDWLDRNLIGRNEPQKISPVGRTPGAAATVFQVRESVTDRVHAEADEMLYVIAGEATVRTGDRAQVLAPGWFVTVPRGASFSLERRGRNPLILLSIVAPARGAQETAR